MNLWGYALFLFPVYKTHKYSLLTDLNDINILAMYSKILVKHPVGLSIIAYSINGFVYILLNSLIADGKTIELRGLKIKYNCSLAINVMPRDKSITNLGIPIVGLLQYVSCIV